MQLTISAANKLERLPRHLHREFPETPVEAIEHDIRAPPHADRRRAFRRLRAVARTPVRARASARSELTRACGFGARFFRVFADGAAPNPPQTSLDDAREPRRWPPRRNRSRGCVPASAQLDQQTAGIASGPAATPDNPSDTRERAVPRIVTLSRSVAALAVISIVYQRLFRPSILNWGATAEEMRARFPGDEFLEDADGVATRAITIDAPPSAVWPWIAQMGPSPRGGAYTYDWIENLLGLNMHSADRVLQGVSAPTHRRRLWLWQDRE